MSVPAAFSEGVSLARPGGRYVSIGNISPGHTTPFDPGLLTRRQVQILPVIRYQPWYLLKVLTLLSETIDRYPWGTLVDTNFHKHQVIDWSFLLSQSVMEGLIPKFETCGLYQFMGQRTDFNEMAVKQFIRD